MTETEGLLAINRTHRRCGCTLHHTTHHARRRALLGGALAAAVPAWAQGDAECSRSAFANFAPADQVEQAAGQQYRQMLQQAGQQHALLPMNNPQVQRLRYIAERIIPFTGACNSRARQWKWEVNLLDSKELNAFCMPGGKICFYRGILDALKLDDDEVAVVMGHEISHALLEHARERMGKSGATNLAGNLLSAVLGLGQIGRSVVGGIEHLANLTYSRDDESQADALGLVLSSRAGYRPQAGVTLWQKMLAASKGAPPLWLSTHPPGEQRIRRLNDLQPRAEALYRAAAKPDRQFGPMRG